MNVQEILFYLLSALTLGCGLGAVLSRNPVNSAMCLVLTIIALAGLFITLDAFFIAAAQIIVYAGAIMVLFLFVIMMLDPKKEERRPLAKIALVASGGLVVILGVLCCRLVLRVPMKTLPGLPVVDGSAEAVGRWLIQYYWLPFEIVSVLLLAAIVSAILLGAKGSK